MSCHCYHTLNHTFSHFFLLAFFSFLLGFLSFFFLSFFFLSFFSDVVDLDTKRCSIVLPGVGGRSNSRSKSCPHPRSTMSSSIGLLLVSSPHLVFACFSWRLFAFLRSRCFSLRFKFLCLVLWRRASSRDISTSILLEGKIKKRTIKHMQNETQQHLPPLPKLNGAALIFV